jgi:MoaA/NifB/PqqE/SkfB family radical SAM enzyme
MRTERELIQSVIDDLGIAEKFKVQEREKIKICNQCPDKDECWGCGVWKWWES